MKPLPGETPNVWKTEAFWPLHFSVFSKKICFCLLCLLLALHCFCFLLTLPCVVASCSPCIAAIHSFLALLLFTLALCCCFHLALLTLALLLFILALCCYYLAWLLLLTLSCYYLFSVDVACLGLLLLVLCCCYSPWVVVIFLVLLLFILCWCCSLSYSPHLPLCCCC